MKCFICRRSYRSGGGLVYDGTMTRGRACQSCADNAVRIVPTVSKAAMCSDCDQAASVCEGCVQARERRSRVSVDVKALAKQLRARAKAYREGGDMDQDYIIGKVEAMESAATFLESRRWA